MKVLVAGTPGVRKRQALENLRAALRALSSEQRIFTSGTPPQVPILDRLIYGENPSAFLKLSEDTRKQKWREAFDRITGQFDRAQNDHHVLGLHLTYRHKQIPSCCVDFKKLADWKPDVIVTLIDDAYPVRDRIHSGGYSSFTLAELVTWRSEELLVGDLLARVINPEQPPQNYLLSVNHAPGMLSRLLFFRDEIARVYLSYNISDSRKGGPSRQVIDTFRQRMAQQVNCAAFDPLTIDELPGLSS